MIPAFLDHLWQSTAFAAGAGVLTLMLRHNRASVRFWIWCAASIKFLIPFSALIALGEYLHVPAATSIAGPAPMFAVQQAAQPFSSTVPVLAVRETGIDWMPVLLSLWALGTASVIAVWLYRWGRIRIALRRATPLAIPVPLPVMSSPSFLEPGLVGFWRPVLLLPDGIAARLSEDEMSTIVAHELCHLRRRDNVTGAVHMFVQAVFWFHPLVWWLGAKLVAERERACDEGVLERGNDPQTYAEGILKVCKFYVQSPVVCAPGVSGADLRRRVETIMANRAVKGLTAFKGAVLVAAAIAAIVVPVAAGVTTGPFAAAEALLPEEAELSRKLLAQSRPRMPVPFTPSSFDRFAGHYQGHGIFTVRREGNRYFTRLTQGVEATRMTPKAEIEIFPESQSKFFAKDVVAQYSFVADNAGNVTELVYHYGGLDRRFARIDDAAAAAIEREVTERIRANRASPGTEDALRRYIQSLQTGLPNYEDMATGIAVRVRWSLPSLERRFQRLGSLTSLAFREVAVDGMDVYDVAFTNGQAEWWIAPLDPDGKIVWSGFRELAVDGRNGARDVVQEDQPE